MELLAFWEEYQKNPSIIGNSLRSSNDFENVLLENLLRIASPLQLYSYITQLIIYLPLNLSKNLYFLYYLLILNLSQQKEYFEYLSLIKQQSIWKHQKKY